MKIQHAFTLIATLTLTSLGHAELTSNVPLDTSRYQIMAMDDLINQAKQGNTHAQFYLAQRYNNGQGVNKDIEQAVYWYTKAADQGVAPAQLNLGRMYLRGAGVVKDASKGRSYLEAAAKRGDNRASFTLALLDEKSQKLADAYKWYDLSARQEMLSEPVKQRARGKITQLAANLTTQDIENAKNSADRWLQAD